jgi:hypothetical protein
VVISNSLLSSEQREKLADFCDEILVRENKGFDFGAWKDAILRDGWEKLADYDSLTLMNDTCFGPLFNLENIYLDMEQKDFWGLTNYRNEKTVMSRINRPPDHIQSYFMCFKKNVINSDSFKIFWGNVKYEKQVKKVIQNYETQLTKILTKSGFTYSVFLDKSAFPGIKPDHLIAFSRPDLCLKFKVPFLKTKIFLNFPYPEYVITFLKKNTNYPVSIIFDYLNQIYDPGTMVCKHITLAKLRPDRAVKSLLWRMIHFARKYKYRERRISYGDENRDKTFYIIGFFDYTCGLFGLISHVLKHIIYTEKFGYIPIVDFQNYDTQYLDPGSLGKENAWEYFFEQPFGYSLCDINKSKNIILSTKTSNPRARVLNFDINLSDSRELQKYYNGLFQAYIRPNKTTRNYLAVDEGKIFTENRKLLGILCRGTDYVHKKPAGHEIQPDPKDVIIKAKEIIKKYNCTHIYLATEDQDIYDLFERNFGNMLLSNGQDRFSSGELKDVQFLAGVGKKRERDKYFLGLEYLSSVNILSKCSCFIGGQTTGTFGVYAMTKGFEYDYVYNLGKYPIQQPTLRSEVKKLITGNL